MATIAVRTREWAYVRNLDPDGKHTTHVDRGPNPTADGRVYWDSWVGKAKSDAAAAAVVRRYHTRPAEELYDVKSDPWQLKNLAAEPAHATTERVAHFLVDVDVDEPADLDLDPQATHARQSAGFIAGRELE